MKFQEAIDLFGAKRRNDKDYRCRCPVHNGVSDDSLSISPGDDDIALIYCHSGCKYKDIMELMGVPVSTENGQPSNEPAPIKSVVPPPLSSDFEPSIKPSGQPKAKQQMVATYPYTDEGGDLLFEKVRLFPPKSFRIRVPSGDDWIWKLGDTRRVIYNLPAVVASDEVWVVEGEKDADRLNSLGLVATCNFEGASKGDQKPKWREEYNPFFAGKTVYVLGDNDEAGFAHARFIKLSLYDWTEEVKMIDLRGLDDGEDVSDWLDAGNTVDDLLALRYEEEQKVSHNWHIRTLNDALQELRPTEYIIDPILPKRSVSIWFGAPGSLKSMLLMDMVFSIKSESEFIAGQFDDPMQCKNANVLWLDLDNGNEILKERFGAMARARGLDGNLDGFDYVSMPKPWLFMADVTSQMDLRMLIEDRDYDLVIIDNLSTITGDVDENSAAMISIMSPIRSMVEDLGVAFILIHHQRKSGAAQGGRAGDALRGHSVIEASLDFAVHVLNDDQNKMLIIKCTKARKFKFGDIRAQYNYEHKPGTRDLETAWFSSPTLEATNMIRETIIKVLGYNRMPITRLVDATYDRMNRAHSKPKIRSYVDQMVSVEGSIITKTGINNAKVHELEPALKKEIGFTDFEGVLDDEEE